jgi:hypothetical protein
MTIRYKSDTFDLTTTNVTTILTCPSVMELLLLKSLQHISSSWIRMYRRRCFLEKSGGSDVEV